MALTTANPNNKESVETSSENQPEEVSSQQQIMQQIADSVTTPNKEKSTCENPSKEQHTGETSNLNAVTLKQMTQRTMTECWNTTSSNQLQKPTATKRKFATTPPSGAAISKKSRKSDFSAETLQYSDSDVSDMETEEPLSREIIGNQQYPKHKPPPIVITSGSAEEIRRLANQVNNQPRSFLINIKKGTKTVTTENWEDYNNFIEVLKAKEHHFHTYSGKQERLMKFVLYKVPDMRIEELKEGLNAENISPIRIVKMTMKRKEYNEHQNYLLYFKGENQKGEQENLLKTLKNVKIVILYKPNWAIYKNKRNGPSQCSRCLQFGHGERGCNRPPICFRCSEQHDSKTCVHLSEDNKKVPNDKLKCHFCGEKHTAISPTCTKRTEIIDKWKAQSKRGNNQRKPVNQRPQDQTEQQKNNNQTLKVAEKSSSVNQNTPPVNPGQQQQESQRVQKDPPRGKTNPTRRRPKNRGNNSNNKGSKKGQQNTKNDKKVTNQKPGSPPNKQTKEDKNSTPPLSGNTENSPNNVQAESSSTSNEKTPTEESTPKDEIRILINTLMERIESLEQRLNEAIGIIAKNTTSNHGS